MVQRTSHLNQQRSNCMLITVMKIGRCKISYQLDFALIGKWNSQRGARCRGGKGANIFFSIGRWHVNQDGSNVGWFMRVNGNTSPQGSVGKARNNNRTQHNKSTFWYRFFLSTLILLCCCFHVSSSPRPTIFLFRRVFRQLSRLHVN